MEVHDSQPENYSRFIYSVLKLLLPGRGRDLLEGEKGEKGEGRRVEGWGSEAVKLGLFYWFLQLKNHQV